MALPLFDLHGITINDPADGFHTNDEVNGFLDSLTVIPRMERVTYFRAILPHWNNIHFGEGGDNIVLQIKPNGDYSLDYYTPWSG